MSFTAYLYDLPSSRNLLAVLTSPLLTSITARGELLSCLCCHYLSGTVAIGGRVLSRNVGLRSTSAQGLALGARSHDGCDIQSHTFGIAMEFMKENSKHEQGLHSAMQLPRSTAQSKLCMYAARDCQGRF